MARKRPPLTVIEWMTQRGFSQYQLAAALGVSQAIVSRWLSGKALPNRSNWQALQALTGLPIGAVLHPASVSPTTRKRKAVA